MVGTDDGARAYVATQFPSFPRIPRLTTWPTRLHGAGPRVGYLTTGAAPLEPIKQGEFDNLCGLCSIVNAIASAAATNPLTRVELRLLFDHGIEALARGNALKGTLKDGMTEERWVGLCRTILRAARRRGIPVRARRTFPQQGPLSSRRALSIIRGDLRSGNVVLVLLWGEIDHCTVLTRFVPGAFLLFDSGERDALEIAACGLAHSRATKPHQFSRTSTLSIRLADPRERHARRPPPAASVRTS